MPITWQAEEKELFRTYVEDFNTSTLPHRKFYNLEFYHQERAARARKKGQSVVPSQNLQNLQLALLAMVYLCAPLLSRLTWGWRSLSALHAEIGANAVVRH